MDIKSKINIVINSGLSGYEIAKRSGVSQSTINRLMNKTYELDKVTIGNASKLERLYDEIK